MIDLLEHLPMARTIAQKHAPFARWIKDDIESEAALALVRAADGYTGDPADFPAFAEPIIRAAVQRMAAGERKRAARVIPAGDHIKQAATDAKPVPLYPPRKMTPGQRWKWRRNMVIAAASRQGFSQRLLADVFDLPRSRVGEIIAEMAGA